MGQEQHTPKGGKRVATLQRTALERLWNGKGGNRKERSPARLVAPLGKSRRTIYRESR
jgi:hypothetical protein